MDFIFGWALFKSPVNYVLEWILRILGSILFCKGPIKKFKGQLELGNLHIFEWDMGHSPIRAHHHSGLGLALIQDLKSVCVGALHPS